MTTGVKYMIGKRIGNIHIDSILGEGGMGSVFKGFDEKLKRHVAIKLIKKDHRSDPLSKARFLREAQVLSKLDHPHICRIWGYEERDGEDFLILEYIEGRTLNQIPNDELEFSQKLRIAEQIAASLEVAHSEQIVHRDLKPANIMVSSDGVVKILDFGLAFLTQNSGAKRNEPLVPLENKVTDLTEFGEECLESETVQLPRDSINGQKQYTDSEPGESSATYFSTQDGKISGTLFFMSPEQADGEEIGTSSDIYSFGLLLQVLFTGRPAYSASSALQLLHKVVEGESEPVSGIDSGLVELIGNLKSKDPSLRPTAREARQKLEQIRLKPWRRKRLFFRMAGAALLMALFGFAVAYTRWSVTKPLFHKDEEINVVCLPVTNASEDASLDWVEWGLADLLRGTLGNINRIQIIPMDEVKSAFDNIKIGSTEDFEQQHVSQLCRLLGSNLVLKIEIRSKEPSFELKYTLFRPDFKPTIGSVRAATLSQAIRDVALRLAHRMAGDSTLELTEDVFSDDPFVNQAYAIGVHKMISAGPQTANTYFEVCLDQDPEFLYAKIQKSETQFQLENFEESRKIAEEVLAEAEKRNDLQVQALTLTILSWHSIQRFDLQAADPYIERSLLLFEKLNDKRGLARAYNHLAVVAYNRNHLDKAAEAWNKAVSYVQQFGSGTLEIMYLNNLGLLAYKRDQIDQAQSYFQNALTKCEEVGARTLMATPLGNLGMIARNRGDIENAIAEYSKANALHIENNNLQGSFLVIYNIAECYSFLGNWGQVLAVLNDGIDVREKILNKSLQIYYLTLLGKASSKMGCWDMAEDFFRSGQEILQAIEVREMHDIYNYYYAMYRLDRHQTKGISDIINQLRASGDEESAQILTARLVYEQRSFNKAWEIAKNLLDSNYLISPVNVSIYETYKNAYELNKYLSLSD